MIRRVVLYSILCLYLGLQDGHLILREDDLPVYIFPYRSELYTDTDRMLLNEGIALPNKENLAAALEDYFS